MIKILLTGAYGLLGSGLIRNIPPGYKLLAQLHQNKLNFPKKQNLEKLFTDIKDKKQVNTTISRLKPDQIIHAAAISDVDYCQKNQKIAWQTNVEGTNNLIAAAKKVRAKFIFISSNAVFDGKKSLYSEEDQPNPINFYGLTKYEAEKLVHASALPFTIIRLITMYGWHPPKARQNPVTWIISNLKKSEKIKIVDNIYLNPLYNLDAADLIWKIILKKKSGIYHLASEKAINRYAWALQTAKVFNFNTDLIEPVKSSFFDGIVAPRPKKTIYSVQKIKKEFNIVPRSTLDGLLNMKQTKF